MIDLLVDYWFPIVVMAIIAVIHHFTKQQTKRLVTQHQEDCALMKETLASERAGLEKIRDNLTVPDFPARRPYDKAIKESLKAKDNRDPIKEALSAISEEANRTGMTYTNLADPVSDDSHDISDE